MGAPNEVEAPDTFSFLLVSLKIKNKAQTDKP